MKLTIVKGSQNWIPSKIFETCSKDKGTVKCVILKSYNNSKFYQDSIVLLKSCYCYNIEGTAAVFVLMYFLCIRILLYLYKLNA